MATVTMTSNNPFLKHQSDNITLHPADPDLALETKDSEATLVPQSNAGSKIGVPVDLTATNSSTPGTTIQPTHCFFITRHWGTTQRIPIYDISSDVDLSSYPTANDNTAISSWFEIAWAVGQQHQASPQHTETYAIQRANWYGNNFSLRSPATPEQKEGEMLVDWKGGWHSSRKNRLIFPAASPHSSHEVTMKADNYIKFREIFVVNSRKYEWHCIHRLSMREFRCDMVLAGGEKKTVARMWQKRGVKEFFAEGGVLVVDSGEVDEVVSLCTAMVVQRKTRQKAYEYSQ